MAGCCGVILGGIHWLAGSYSGILSGILGGIGCSSGTLGGIHYRATLAGYWAGSTGDTQRDNRRDPMAGWDPLAGRILGGMYW